MELFRFNIQYPPVAIGSFAPGLFSQKRDRVALIKQPELARRLFACTGINVNTSPDKVAVKVGHQTADISRGIWP